MSSRLEHMVTAWKEGLGEVWGAGPISWSRDGSRLAVVVQEGVGENDDGMWIFESAVHLLGLDGTDHGPIAGTEGATDARLSPDGKRVAFVRRDQGNCRSALLVVEVDGGHPRRLGVARCDQDAVFDWSPDARFVAYDDNLFPPSIWVVDRDGSHRHAVLAPGIPDIHQVHALSWQPAN